MNEYDVKMLDAYIQKPQKLDYYKNAFENIDNGKIWNWSWWSFFFGILFLIYRKAYLGAFIFFLISGTGNFIDAFIPTAFPIASLIIWIAQGGIGVYFIHQKYMPLKKQIESNFSNEADRVASMAKAGGAGKVFTILLSIFMILFIVGVLAAVAIPRLAATRDDAEILKASTNITVAIQDIAAYKVAHDNYSNDFNKMTNATGFEIISSDPLQARYSINGKKCIKLNIDNQSDITLQKGADSDAHICRDLYKQYSINQMLEKQNF